MIEYYDKPFNDEAERQGYNGPGFYFWDETAAYCYGPFQTAEDAMIGLEQYSASL